MADNYLQMLIDSQDKKLHLLEEAERLDAAREELHRIANDPGWHRAY